MNLRYEVIYEYGYDQYFIQYYINRMNIQQYNFYMNHLPEGVRSNRFFGINFFNWDKKEWNFIKNNQTGIEIERI